MPDPVTSLQALAQIRSLARQPPGEDRLESAQPMLVSRLKLSLPLGRHQGFTESEKQRCAVAHTARQVHHNSVF